MPVNRRRPFSSLLLLGRSGRPKTLTAGSRPFRPLPRPSPAAESATDESVSDLEATIHSGFPSSRAASLETGIQRLSSPSPSPPPQQKSSSAKTDSTEPASPASPVNASPSAQAESSCRAPLGTAPNTSNSNKPLESCLKNEQGDDDKESLDGCSLLEKWTALAADTAVTATTATRPGMSSPFAAAPLPRTTPPPLSQPSLRSPRRFDPTVPSHYPPSRSQQPRSKRAKVSITLGVVPTTPKCPLCATSSHLHPPDSCRSHASASTCTVPVNQGRRIVWPKVHPSRERSTTLSLTSLVPTAAAPSLAVMPSSTTTVLAGASVLREIGESYHSVRMSQSQQRVPCKAHGVLHASGSAARWLTPTSGAAAAAAFSPPPDTEAVPESVRMDREVINTMLVSRRTSSRWSQYARDGAPWTSEEEVWLLRQHRAACPTEWLSAQLSRTKSAVKARLKRHQDARG